MGKIVGIYVGKQKGEGKTEVAFAEFVAGHGVLGDCHAGRDANRQVSLFAQETLNQLLAEGFTVNPSALSANLFVEGLNLNSLKPGAQLRIGDVTLELLEPRKPCRNITQIDNRLPKRLFGQCGHLARIVNGGIVRSGDAIELVVNEKQMKLEFV
jgi:MOSC domain-containing protein YiiM